MVSLGQSLFLMSLRVTIFPSRSTSIRRTWKGCSLRTVLSAAPPGAS